MSDKFKTVVTTQGMDLLNKAIANEKDLLITKAVASANAYSTDKLVDLNDENYKNASHNQETTINRISSAESATLNFEIVFDGTDIRYDYTLNTVFLVAEVDGHERLFAVIKANQPQYMNAYEGGSRTNLQINFGFELANRNVAIKINSAAMATLKHLSDLKKELETSIEETSNSLSVNIAEICKTAMSNIDNTRQSLNNANAQLEQKLDKTKQELKRETEASVKHANDRAVDAEKEIQKQLETQEKKLTEADNKLNNRIDTLKIGGQNLSLYTNKGATGWGMIYDTGESFSFDTASTQGTLQLLESGNSYNKDTDILLTSANLKREGKYIFSMLVKTDRDFKDKEIEFEAVSNGNYVFSEKAVSKSFSAKENEVFEVTFTFDAVSYAENVQVMLMLRSEIFSYNAEIWDRQIREGETYVTYAPNYQDIIDKAEELIDDKVAEIEAREQAKRIGPTSWILDRSTTPWTIRFDNGCTLQFPDYKTTATIYGYGHTSSTVGTDFVAYPLPYNIIRAANGGITVEKFKQANSGFEYWAPSTKVNNPVHKDTDFNWKNAYGDPRTKDVSYGRKTVFARVMYELGIWDADDVISVGAIRR